MNKQETINREDILIHNIISELNNVETQTAQELLYKIITMLTVTKSPIDIAKIRKGWFPEIEEERKKTAMKNPKIHGHDHTCIAHTNQIYIYHRTSLWYYKLCANQCLYYALTKDRSKCLRKLTKTNLLNDYKTTRFEDPLVNFLKDNSVYKKNLITQELEVLTILK